MFNNTYNIARMYCAYFIEMSHPYKVFITNILPYFIFAKLRSLA